MTIDACQMLDVIFVTKAVSEPRSDPSFPHRTFRFLNENMPSLQRSLQRRFMRLRAGYGRQLFVTRIISQSNRGRRSQVSHQPTSERKKDLKTDSPGDGILLRNSSGLTVSKVFVTKLTLGFRGRKPAACPSSVFQDESKKPIHWQLTHRSIAVHCGRSEVSWIHFFVLNVCL